MFSHLQIGQHAVFVLDHNFVESVEKFLQHSNKGIRTFWFKIASIDNTGIWVEHPKFHAYDHNTHESRDFLINIFIPSHFIISAVIFPNEAFTNMSVDPDNRIGFL